MAATDAEREDALEKSLSARLERWRACGCTTVEVKSGTGWRRAPRSACSSSSRGAVQRVPTACSARRCCSTRCPRSIATAATSTLAEMRDRILPEIADASAGGRRGRVLRSGGVHRRRVPLGPGASARARISDQAPRGAARAERRRGAGRGAAVLSADHLECATLEDWQALGRAGVVGVLLPGAALTLGQKLPDARMLRESGARVAIATDFNPAARPRSRCSSARRWRRVFAGSAPRKRSWR